MYHIQLLNLYDEQVVRLAACDYINTHKHIFLNTLLNLEQITQDLRKSVLAHAKISMSNKMYKRFYKYLLTQTNCHVALQFSDPHDIDIKTEILRHYQDYLVYKGLINFDIHYFHFYGFFLSLQDIKSWRVKDLLSITNSKQLTKFVKQGMTDKVVSSVTDSVVNKITGLFTNVKGENVQNIISQLFVQMEPIKQQIINTFGQIENTVNVIKALIITIIIVILMKFIAEHPKFSAIVLSTISTLFFSFTLIGEHIYNKSDPMTELRKHFDTIEKWCSSYFTMTKQGNSEFPYFTIVPIIITVFSLFILKKIPDGKELNSFLILADRVPKAITGVSKLHELAVNSVNWFRDYYYMQIKKDPDYIPYQTTPRVITDWVERIRFYTDAVNKKTISFDSEVCEEVSHLYQQYITLSSDAVKMNWNKDIKDLISKMAGPVKSLYDFAEMHGINGLGKVKNEPLVILLHGESGVGKSVAQTLITLDFERLLGLNPKHKNIYLRRSHNEFWDAYTGERIIVYDDWGQMKDTQNVPNEEFFELINSKGTVNYQLHMASLQEKGNSYFKGDVIVMSSNISNLKNCINSLIKPEAIVRRIDACIHVGVKERYQKVTGLNNVKGIVNPKGLDPIKAQAGVDKDCDYNLHVWEFHYSDASTQDILDDSQPMDYFQLMDSLKEKYTNITHRNTHMKSLTEKYAVSGGFEGYRNTYLEKPSQFTKQGTVFVDNFWNKIVPNDDLFSEMTPEMEQHLQFFTKYYSELTYEQLMNLTDHEIIKQYLAEKFTTLDIDPFIKETIFYTDSTLIYLFHNILYTELTKEEDYLSFSDNISQAEQKKFHTKFNKYQAILDFYKDELERIMKKMAYSIAAAATFAAQNWMSMATTVISTLLTGLMIYKTVKKIYTTTADNIKKLKQEPLVKMSSQEQFNLGELESEFGADELYNSQYQPETYVPTNYQHLLNNKSIFVTIPYYDDEDTPYSQLIFKAFLTHALCHKCKNNKYVFVDEFPRCQKCYRIRFDLCQLPNDEGQIPQVFNNYETQMDWDWNRSINDSHLTSHGWVYDSKTGNRIFRTKKGNNSKKAEYTHMSWVYDAKSGKRIFRTKAKSNYNKSKGEYVSMSSNVSSNQIKSDVSVVPQGIIDHAAYNLATGKIGTNSYILNQKLKKLDGSMEEINHGHILFIKGHMALINRHVLDNILAFGVSGKVGKNFLITIYNSYCSEGIDVNFSDCIYFKSKNVTHDLALIVFPKYIAMAADIVDHFVTEKDITSIPNLRDRQHSTMNVLVVNHSKGKAIVRNVVTGSRVHTCDSIMADDEEMTGMLGYDSPNQKGDCGSAVLLYSNNRVRKLIGIHSAGSEEKQTSMATIVTREDIEELMKYVPFERQYAFAAWSFDFGGENLPKGQFIPMFKVKKLAQPSNSSLMQTPLFDLLTDEEGNRYRSNMVPALLSTSSINGVKHDPLLVGLEKAGRKPLLLDQSMIDDAALSFEVKLRSMHAEIDKRVLSWEECIHGVEGTQFLKGINRSSSPGYPYINKVRKSKGKQDWFGSEEWITDSPLALELKEELENAEQMMLKGIRPIFYKVDSLKDERRPIEKVHAGKTRVFNADSILLILLFRKYYGAFFSAYKKERYYNEGCIGTNAYNADWDTIATMLLNTGNNIAAGDFSNYDGTLNNQIMIKVGELINNWYEDSNNNNNIIREFLWYEIFNSIHICRDTVYMWQQSHASGEAFTADVNCLYSSLAFRMVLNLVKPKNEIIDFNKECCLLLYGDDSLLALSNRVSKLVSQEDISKGFKMIGMDYTDETKSTSFSEYRKLEEVNFLKRGFRYNQDIGRITGALSKTTIYEMLCWYHKTEEPKMQVLANVEQSIFEAYFWGEEFFNQHSKMVVSACKKIMVYPEVHPYHYYSYMISRDLHPNLKLGQEVNVVKE